MRPDAIQYIADIGLPVRDDSGYDAVERHARHQQTALYGQSETAGRWTIRMLLSAAGVYQAEDISALSMGTELYHIRDVFLVQARMAAIDADEPVVLRPDERTEAYALENGGARPVVLLRIRGR